LWRAPTSGYVTGFPAIEDEAVIAPTTTGVIAHEAATGDTAWGRPLGSAAAPPVVADRKVYVGREDGHVYATDAPTGNLHWELPVGPGVENPAVVHDGRCVLRTMR
jgi:outer membrane protein assembly factor BamB